MSGAVVGLTGWTWRSEGTCSGRQAQPPLPPRRRSSWSGFPDLRWRRQGGSAIKPERQSRLGGWNALLAISSYHRLEHLPVRDSARTSDEGLAEAADLLLCVSGLAAQLLDLRKQGCGMRAHRHLRWSQANSLTLQGCGNLWLGA